MHQKSCGGVLSLICCAAVLVCLSMYSRREEGPLPSDAIGVNESTLVILNPQPEDSGNYTCVSRGLASSTLALMVVENMLGTFICLFSSI